MAATTHEYVSPDGSLRFLVVTADDGDVALGFQGFAWHTHADLLAAAACIPEAEAVGQFVEDLLGNRSVIAVSRVRGEVRDVWITDDPDSEFLDLLEGETIELRYWDGRKWSDAEPGITDHAGDQQT
jgi:hypothetical protein